MTVDKHFKRQVRELAKRTGRSYAASRALLEKQLRQSAQADESGIEGSTREDDGRGGPAGREGGGSS